MSKKYQSVTEYMNDFSGLTRERLEQMHAIIMKIMPGATERISYNIPAFFLKGKLIVYIAGFANHTSLYPGRTLSDKYIKLSKEFASGKSTLKFPNDKDLPIELIDKFVKISVEEVS